MCTEINLMLLEESLLANVFKIDFRLDKGCVYKLEVDVVCAVSGIDTTVSGSLANSCF
jgi:hypothetical protein